MSEIPAIAFVGHVNPGKTSAIATLLEEEGLLIGPYPGTTTKCQRFELKGPDGKTLIVFYDTPGFQNAPSALARLQELAATRSSALDVFRGFVAAFAREPQYENECELFAPIVNGAGIVYVVDAAEPLRPVNEAEMKVLQMACQPTLALINWTDEPVHREQWEKTLRLHFGDVWEFNAHEATLAERLDLIKKLPVRQPLFPVLQKAAAVLEENWKHAEQPFCSSDQRNGG